MKTSQIPVNGREVVTLRMDRDIVIAVGKLFRIKFKVSGVMATAAPSL